MSIIFIISMFDLLWVPNFIKIGAHFQFQVLDLYWVLNFKKIGAHCNFETKSAQVFNFQSKSANIILMIIVFWPALSAKFHSIGNIFNFWDQMSLEWGDWYLFWCWICYLGIILIFYCSLHGGYCPLLLVTACSYFSTNVKFSDIFENSL